MTRLSRDGSKPENRLVVLIRRPGTAPRTEGTGNSLTFFAKKTRNVSFIGINSLSLRSLLTQNKQYF